MTTEFDQGLARTQAENTIKSKLRRMHRVSRVCLALTTVLAAANASTHGDSKILLGSNLISAIAPFGVRRRTINAVDQVVLNYGSQIESQRSPYVEDSVIAAGNSVLPWQRPIPPPGKLAKYYPPVLQTLSAELAGVAPFVADFSGETGSKLFVEAIALTGLVGGAMFDTVHVNYEHFQGQLDNVEGAVPPQQPL